MVHINWTFFSLIVCLGRFLMSVHGALHCFLAGNVANGYAHGRESQRYRRMHNQSRPPTLAAQFPLQRQPLFSFLDIHPRVSVPLQVHK